MSGLSKQNPFVGPRPIQQGEPLYGRDVEIRELYHRLQARRIVVLHSPSGAGKSSLVQAGLIPRLLEGGYDVWKPIRVNLDPAELDGVPEGTNRYLLSAMISLEDELPEKNRRAPAALSGLDFREYVESRPRRKGRGQRPVVLVFDQFEEVLTTAALAVEAKRSFFTAIGRALEVETYWALFLIREDHLGALAPYRDRIPTQLSNTFRLDLLGLAGAREAAVNLAEQGGRSFPGVDQLVRDLSLVQVQQPDGSFVAEQGLHVEPVQLQVVCRRLWDAMPADDLSIDPEDIDAYASVTSALAGYYADILRVTAGGDEAIERALREWVGSKLIVGGIRSPVRREAGKTAGLDNRLIASLLDSYLVRSEPRAGAHWYELSHDRLVEPVLRDNEAWAQEHLHPLQVQARLWEDARRSAVLLLGAEALQGAQSWADENPKLLTESEREFLAQSREQQARDRAARRRLVALAAIAVGVAAVVGVLGIVAFLARGRALAAEAAAETERATAVAERNEADNARVEAENAWREARAQAERARDASLMAGARELLARGRPGPATRLLLAVKRPEEVRGWQQLARDGLRLPIPWVTLRGHHGAVNHATWSPNGARIVTVSADREVRVWLSDGTGRSVVLGEHEDAVDAAVWSPDGSRVATVSRDETVRVWQVAGTAAPVIFREHERAIKYVAWSPDGRSVASASSDGTARVWQADGSGTPVVLRGHEGSVETVEWSPNGQQIITASADRTARVWRADGAGAARVLRGHKGRVNSASWSPDGRQIVTASADATARIWRADGPGKPLVLGGHAGEVRVAVWSPDSARIVTASVDRTARVWRADGAGGPVSLAGHEREVVFAEWSDDGQRIVTTSFDGTARVWMSDGTGTALVLAVSEGPIETAMWSPDGAHVVTACADGTAQVWRVTSDEPRVLVGHLGGVQSAAWSPDGRRIATASFDGTARVWMADGTGELTVLAGHDKPLVLAAWDSEGRRLATLSEDRTVRVWQIEGTGETVVLSGHEDIVFSAAWSPDGRQIVTASADRTARVWQADGSGGAAVLAGHEDMVHSAAWSPDGRRIVTASADGTARVWQARGSVWESERRFGPTALANGEPADNLLEDAAWSPDGRHLVAASWDNRARVWKVDGTGEPVVLAGHEGLVSLAAWSPDGRLILTVSGDSARIWAGDGSELRFVFTGHGTYISSAAWDPGGEFVVTSSGDRTAQVWRADGAGAPVVLAGHEEAVTSAAWSPDGHRIVTGSRDNTARIWRVAVPTLRGALEEATIDCLSPEMRHVYLDETDQEARTNHYTCERSRRTPP